MVSAAAILFAVNGTVSKVILASGLSSPRLAQVRSTGAFAVLLLAIALARPHLLRVTRRELAFLAVFGVVGLASVQVFYFLAIHRLAIGIALLIQYLAPLLVALWARFAMHEAVRRRIWGALILGLAGLALMVQLWRGVELDGLGVTYALIATVAFAVYLLLAERAVSRRDLGLVLRLPLRHALLVDRAAVVELPRRRSRPERLAARPPRRRAFARLGADDVDGAPRHDRPFRPRRRRPAPRFCDARWNRRDARARGRDHRGLRLAGRVALGRPDRRRAGRPRRDPARAERQVGHFPC